MERERSEVTLHPALRGVRAVLFDAGGTLVHPDWERLARLAAEEAESEFSEAELQRALKEALRAADLILQRGESLPADMRLPGWLFRRMYSALGLEREACERLSRRMVAAHGERHLWCGLDPEAVHVISELKRAGLRVAVISNTEDGRLEELLQLVQIAAHFDFLIDSHVVGHHKPDAAIFHLALARLGLPPHEAAYVGDSYGHDALGARRVGMQPILLDPLDLYPESDVPRISSLGELIGGAAVTQPHSTHYSR